MDELTPKQQKVLEFVERQLARGNPPSQREIAAHFGIAQNAVCQLISYLRRKGYVESSGSHRGIRLSRNYVGNISRVRKIPVIGRVVAGEPVVTEENIDEYVDFEELLRYSKDMFLLRVVGDSMVDEGIMDGDYVLVKPETEIGDGQIAAVLLDEEITVKKIYFRADRIALKPANKAARYKTRYIGKNDRKVKIIGRVTGCVRAI